MDFGHIATIATQIAAMAGVVFSFFRWVLPRAKKALDKIGAIDKVVAELSPNGGKSIRDAVDRIESILFEIQSSAGRIDARQWAIVTALDVPIWESDQDGLCVRGNTALLRLLEMQLSELQGNGWENVVHPDDRPKVWQEWSDSIERERTFDMSYRIVAAQSGANHRVHAICTPYHDRAGKVLGYVGRYTEVMKL